MDKMEMKNEDSRTKRRKTAEAFILRRPTHPPSRR
jgi:hypothetical protein